MVESVAAGAKLADALHELESKIGSLGARQMRVVMRGLRILRERFRSYERVRISWPSLSVGLSTRWIVRVGLPEAAIVVWARCLGKT